MTHNDMEQKDHDILIRIDERQQAQMKMLETHIRESKEFHVEYVGKLQNCNDRLIIVEEAQKKKDRVPLFKFFAFLLGIFGIKI